MIELLIVIAIIGILATASITAYIGVTKKAARSEAYSNLGSIRLLEEQFFAENACYQPLVAGVCPAAAATFTFIPATQAFVPAFLPGFRPGAGLSFTYSIRVTNGVGLPTAVAVPIPYDGSTAALATATTPCFIVTATALPNTRVVGDIFAIDCNNNRNF